MQSSKINSVLFSSFSVLTFNPSYPRVSFSAAVSRNCRVKMVLLRISGFLIVVLYLLGVCGVEIAESGRAFFESSILMSDRDVVQNVETENKKN